MPKTVILLGAGASFGSEFELPLTKSILDRAVVRGSGYAVLKRALAIYAPRGRAVDLEEFLTHLDLTHQVWNERWRESEVEEFSKLASEARRELEEFLSDRLRHDERSSALHVELFRKLRSHDTIISLNYDRIADQSLFEIGGRNPYGLPSENSRLGWSYNLLGSGELMAGAPAGLTANERANGLFLKLHGSLSWLVCPSTKCVRNHEIVEQFNERAEVRPTPRDPCRACGTSLRRLIVAPTLGKQFVESPRLELLWHLAHRELAAAGQLVVIGVSLPPSDTRLRWLLASAWKTRPWAGPPRHLYIVNPDRQAASRLASVCGVRLTARYDNLNELNRTWMPNPAVANWGGSLD